MAKKKSAGKPDAATRKLGAALEKAEAKAARWKARAQKARAAADRAEKRVAKLEKQAAKGDRAAGPAQPALTVAEAPAPSAPDSSWTVARLRVEARSRGLEGYSRKTKQQLIDDLA